MNKHDVIRVGEWLPFTDTFEDLSKEFYEIEYLFDLVGSASNWFQIVLEGNYSALDILICLAYALGVEPGVLDFDEIFDEVGKAMGSITDSDPDKATYNYWLENHYLKEECRNYVFKQISSQSKRIPYKEAKKLVSSISKDVLECLEAYYNS
ncbi:MAG: hypothetical protein K2H85_07125 [Allobaculum sp.]|nr:hypothetical protein [Allobaculum sp.]